MCVIFVCLLFHGVVTLKKRKVKKQTKKVILTDSLLDARLSPCWVLLSLCRTERLHRVFTQQSERSTNDHRDCAAFRVLAVITVFTCFSDFILGLVLGFSQSDFLPSDWSSVEKCLNVYRDEQTPIVSNDTFKGELIIRKRF